MERLADRYELGDALGQGRSTVFRAVDTRLRRDVAIKRVQLLAGHEDAEQVRTRALREAQASARLNNPSVVAVYDVVEEAGAIWLVMELVDGPSLSEVVSDAGPLPHERAATIGLGVLTALQAAHRVGVVHRDVKPANVLVLEGDRVKLTDFGVATIRDESRVTATGLIVGSPSYMSPEQATAGEITPATDLWALGALLYFAVEGEPPFQAGNALATASAVVHGEPRAPQSPGPLSPIVARLLTKAPTDRPAAGEVRAALARVARGSRAGSASRPSVPAPSVAAGTLANPSTPPGAPAEPGPGARPRATSPDATEVHAFAPVPPAPADPRRPRRLPVPVPVAVGIALLVVVALAVAVPGLTRDSGRDGAEGGTTPTTEVPADDPATPSGQASTTPTTEPATTTVDGPVVPAGWSTYDDPQGAYSIAYPEGWVVRPTGASYRTDFVDPASGAFLRIEWTSTPKDDVVQDWRVQAARFGARNPSYEEIRIEAVTYRDYDAALWEFRHDDGETLHTGNIGLVTGGKGYALMFRAPESRWADSEPLVEQFKQAFSPS